MKDSDIIKALECCAKLTCSECPYYEKRHIRCRELRKLALGLINRQKAEIKTKDTEIDILIKKKKGLKDEIAEQQSEIERLTNYIVNELSVLPTKIKSEAIKEFAERLKEELRGNSVNGDIYDMTAYSCIDALVKEMVGE